MIQCMYAQPSCLAKKPYRCNEMRNVVPYGDLMPCKYKRTDANRFVQVKKILCMHDFEVENCEALNKWPEGAPIINPPYIVNR